MVGKDGEWEMRSVDRINTLGKAYLGVLLFIFGGIVLHAPFSVGFGVLFPDYELLIKSWKEILMLIAGAMALVLMYLHRRYDILRDPIMKAIAIYGTLHLVLLAWQPTGLASVLAGLAIDLRYVLYFGLVYIAMSLYPQHKKAFIKVGITGAVVVLGFALLQVFILPVDILKYIGYSVDTISPYLTVDQNHDFIRINSTLRGPNPLGAYAGMVIALIVAAIMNRKIKKEHRPLVLILVVGGLIALWSSYSRSALFATIVAIVIVLVATNAHQLAKKIALPIAVIGMVTVIISGVMVASNTDFVSNVLLHENPNGGSSINSNEDHISSLEDGVNRLIRQPLGAGIGSTGSASLYSDSPLIIENQYLFTAHESGWLGLGIFMYIFVTLQKRLWEQRRDWLAVGIFASGIGLALIGLLLPVWVDDTVSIVWWGLAAVVVSGRWYIVDSKRIKHGK